MKTVAYIDAQNLYFGVLTKSPYKWLDVYRLFAERILPSHTPGAELVRIKFYTAPIKARFASDPKAPERQTAYHLALKGKYPDKIEIIEGYYSADCKDERCCDNEGQKARVWKLEEKLTDVSMALDIYRDALKGVYDQAVLCSNDSDLIPALRLVREDFPDKRLGLVMPRRRGVNERRATELEQHAHWTQHQLSDADLAQCQLPDKVTYRLKKKGKRIDKPEAWK